MTRRDGLRANVTNWLLASWNQGVYSSLSVGVGRLGHGAGFFADGGAVGGLLGNGWHGLSGFGGWLTILSTAWFTEQAAEFRGCGLLALAVSGLTVRNGSSLLLLLGP